eukprot:PhM_4_TR9094/c0_g1_i1/m.36797
MFCVFALNNILLHFILTQSHAGHTTQLLNAVEQNIAVLEDLLVVLVDLVRLLREHVAAHLVNAAVQSPAGDKTAQLRVQRRFIDAERRRHRRQGHAAVRLQELCEGQHAHLAVVVVGVRREEDGAEEHVRDLRQGGEDTLVLALVDGAHEAIDVRQLRHNRDDIAAVNDLLFQCGAVEDDERDGRGDANERLEVNQLLAAEGADAVEEQLRGLLEVPRAHQIQPLVHLQAVAALPVAVVLQQLVRCRDALNDQLCVAEGKPHTDALERKVKAGADAERPPAALVVELHALLAVADLAKVFRLLQERVAHV